MRLLFTQQITWQRSCWKNSVAFFFILGSIHLYFSRSCRFTVLRQKPMNLLPEGIVSIKSSFFVFVCHKILQIMIRQMLYGFSLYPDKLQWFGFRCFNRYFKTNVYTLNGRRCHYKVTPWHFFPFERTIDLVIEWHSALCMLTDWVYVNCCNSKRC